MVGSRRTFPRASEWSARRMNKEDNQIPSLRNLGLLHQGEESIRGLSLICIESDEGLSLNLSMVECVMDKLQFYRIEYPASTNNLLTIHLLGFRLFNAASSAIKLALSGYYQAAGLHIRDILETAFLLDYFSTDEALIERWRAIGDEGVRTREFNLAKIRIALDGRDGFTEERRKHHYKLLCELAAHPAPAGFRMLQPCPGADAQMGCFFARDLLNGTLQELAKTLLVAWENFKWYFEPETLPHFMAMLHYLELSMTWSEKTYGRPVDRQDLETVRAIVDRMAKGLPVTIIRG